MADDQIVNEEQTSTEETASTEDEVLQKSETQTQEQPLTKAEVQKMIAEQTELAKREIQSAKDKARAEVTEAQRRARFAEDSMDRVRGKFGDLDPEARQVLEVEDLRARNQFFERRQQQEMVERQRAEEAQALNQTLLDHLSDMGIDPKDERIDWGQTATNLPEGLRRFNKSVAKIAREDVEAAKQKAKQDAKDKLAQERKESGLDSSDTGIPVGVSKGIPTDMKKFRKWIADLPPEEYATKKKDIDEMLQKGQIK